MTDRILGVLGGMGPLASAHFMVRLTQLTPASTDQEHIPTVLWSDPRIPDRTAASSGAGDPWPKMLRGIQGLVAAGCGAIVVPCNTAHGWYENMVAGAGVPVLHIVDAAAHALAKVAASGSKVAVVGTGRTLRMRLYQDRLEPRGWTVLVPDASEMERLVSPAIAMVKANRVTEAYAPLAEMVEILAGRGAAAVVLGCTEIPLAMQAGPSSRLPVPLVDTIDALAIAAIAWSRAGNWTSVT